MSEPRGELQTPTEDLSRLARAAGIKLGVPYCLGDIANLVETMAMELAEPKELVQEQETNRRKYLEGELWQEQNRNARLQSQIADLKVAAMNVLAYRVQAVKEFPDHAPWFAALEKVANPLIEVDLTKLGKTGRVGSVPVREDGTILVEGEWPDVEPSPGIKALSKGMRAGTMSGEDYDRLAKKES